VGSPCPRSAMNPMQTSRESLSARHKPRNRRRQYSSDHGREYSARDFQHHPTDLDDLLHAFDRSCRCLQLRRRLVEPVRVGADRPSGELQPMRDQLDAQSALFDDGTTRITAATIARRTVDGAASATAGPDGTGGSRRAVDGATSPAASRDGTSGSRVAVHRAVPAPTAAADAAGSACRTGNLTPSIAATIDVAIQCSAAALQDAAGATRRDPTVGTRQAVHGASTLAIGYAAVG
jgi:hypothetical protein